MHMLLRDLRDVATIRIYLYAKSDAALARVYTIDPPENTRICIERLPNVGGDSHTILHHLETRFSPDIDDAADFLVTLQDYPFDHLPSRACYEDSDVRLAEWISDAVRAHTKFTSLSCVCARTVESQKHQELEASVVEHFGIDFSERGTLRAFQFCQGNQFVLHKSIYDDLDVGLLHRLYEYTTMLKDTPQITRDSYAFSCMMELIWQQHVFRQPFQRPRGIQTFRSSAASSAQHVYLEGGTGVILSLGSVPITRFHGSTFGHDLSLPKYLLTEIPVGVRLFITDDRHFLQIQCLPMGSTILTNGHMVVGCHTGILAICREKFWTFKFIPFEQAKDEKLFILS